MSVREVKTYCVALKQPNNGGESIYDIFMFMDENSAEFIGQMIYSNIENIHTMGMYIGSSSAYAGKMTNIPLSRIKENKLTITGNECIEKYKGILEDCPYPKANEVQFIMNLTSMYE